MRDRWYRIEMLLPAVPAILVIVQLIFFPERTMDFQFRDTTYVVAVFWILIALFLLQFVYYLLHWVLLTRGRESYTITRVYVIGSTAALLLLTLPVLFLGNPVRAATAQEYIEIVLLREELQPLVLIFALFYLLLQVFFLVYFFVKFFKIGLLLKKNRRP